MMKLLITIVQNDDVAALTEAIVKSGHSATKLSSSGGILRSGAEYGLSHRKHFFTRLAGGGLVSPAHNQERL